MGWLMPDLVFAVYGRSISTLVGDALSLKSTADVWGENNDGENNQPFGEFTLGGRGIHKQMRCVCVVRWFSRNIKTRHNNYYLDFKR